MHFTCNKWYVHRKKEYPPINVNFREKSHTDRQVEISGKYIEDTVLSRGRRRCADKREKKERKRNTGRSKQQGMEE
jgi:hypothetical protein